MNRKKDLSIHILDLQHTNLCFDYCTLVHLQRQVLPQCPEYIIMVSKTDSLDSYKTRGTPEKRRMAPLQYTKKFLSLVPVEHTNIFFQSFLQKSFQNLFKVSDVNNLVDS